VDRRFREAASFWVARLEASDPAMADLSDTFRRVADLEVLLYPAMLALASLAALAVAWWGYRRLVERNGDALAPMRDFRFADHLVWLLIVGVALLIVPLGDVASRAGANLATFMAALYVLRGAAIVVALSNAGGFAAFLMGVMAVLLLPLFAGAALVIGLSDTWLDLRRHRTSDDAASS
jgi:predicted signal transduction protein with EAL and GGDEF domain